jgi:TolB-like protein/cytochrome c-type biogenesis protein CcmH/NrfG
VTDSSHAVFLSYASQDAEAAQRICEALRVAGIQVFLDQSELRGGDAWDQKIRREIHDCALFIPIVSQHTQERLEGYFRHEWKLAIERAHHMAEEKPFLVPVVIDGTGDQEAFVPDAFRAVHWTRLPDGDTPPAFVERVERLLSPELSPLSAVPGGAARERVSGSSRQSKPIVLAGMAVVVLAALAYLLADRLWISRHAAPAVATFAPPPHSVAVLPFVNLSGDAKQEYFSDGLAEELLDALAQINDLQVAARTSAFSFKGTNTDIGTIARKLNVGAVLEGSVRRSGNTVRISTQLINAVTGFHLWSHTYDRDLGDVLKLETDIAGAVASALKVSLLGDTTSKIEVGGTRNPAAFDAYLRGRRAQLTGHSDEDLQTAIAAYTEAIGLDPSYALAYAWRSLGELEPHDKFEKSHSDALKAIALTPDLAEGHLALAWYFRSVLDLSKASDEYERALALAPGNARVLGDYALFSIDMGRTEPGIAAARRGVVLDPLNHDTHYDLGLALLWSHHSKEAITAFQESLALDPENPLDYAMLGFAYYDLGDRQSARSSCEVKSGDFYSQWCLAITYDKLGRHADAEAVLAKMKADAKDDAAYQYATIYAQWGNTPKALEWLETALRLRDPGLGGLGLTDDYGLLEPLRHEPRFQAVLRKLKSPE